MQIGCKTRKSIALALAVHLIVGCKTTDTEVIERPALSGGFTASLMRPSPKKTANIQMALARSLEAQDDLAGAQAAYQNVIKLTPKSAEAHHRLAIVYDRQGKYEISEQTYQTALKLTPGNADIFCDIGYSQYAQRRWAEAERNLRQAIAINSDHNRAHNNLAMVLAHNERYEEALAEFRKGGATAAESQLNVSFVMAMNGRLDDAQSACRLALSADPTLKAAQARLTELDSVIAKTASMPRQDEIASQTKMTDLKQPKRIAAKMTDAKQAEPVASDVSAVRKQTAALEGAEKWLAPKVADSTSRPESISKLAKTQFEDSEVVPATEFELPVIGDEDKITELGGTSTSHTREVWNLTPGFESNR